EPIYAKSGFKRIPKGQVKMPGPVDPARLLVAELAAGAFDGVAGLVRPGWGKTRLASLSCPPGSERAHPQQKGRKSCKARQDADAAHDAGITHLQANPIIALECGASAYWNHARHVHTIAISDPPHVTAGRIAQRTQHLSRGRYLREFPWVRRADVCQRGQLAIRRTPEAEFIGRRCRAPQSGLDFLKINRPAFAGRRGERHLIDSVGHCLTLNGDVASVDN